MRGYIKSGVRAAERRGKIEEIVLSIGAAAALSLIQSV